jgi:phosphoribosylglycinamide formyltransferase-1
MKLRVGVLGSTRGTALQGVLDAVSAGKLEVEIAVIISDKESAGILERARKHNVRPLHLSPVGLKRAAFDERVSAELRAANVELVLLIGYMRIVSAGFVNEWRGRLLNVHEAVLAAGVKESGCTIHQVTEEVDAGPIVLQKRCSVLQGDTADTLKDRVQALEQQAFVEVLTDWRTA